jgi:hypothetical protein
VHSYLFICDMAEDAAPWSARLAVLSRHLGSVAGRARDQVQRSDASAQVRLLIAADHPARM